MRLASRTKQNKSTLRLIMVKLMSTEDEELILKTEKIYVCLKTNSDEIT